MDQDILQRFAEFIEPHRTGSMLLVTGAGVSAASGIRTFRGSEPDAIWRTDPTELATRGFFERDPVTHWQWYLSRFAGVDEAQPNPAHTAIAEWERLQNATGDWLLVTQNIDTLHEQAGSRVLIKVHGSADRLRCTRTGCVHAAPSGSLPRSDVPLADFRRRPHRRNLPRCPQCSGLLRPHVLFFDEYYDEHDDYQFDRVRQAAGKADAVVFVGTSLSVGVTAMVLQNALLRSAAVAIVDPNPPAGLPNSAKIFAAAAEVLLPAWLIRIQP